MARLKRLACRAVMAWLCAATLAACGGSSSNSSNDDAAPDGMVTAYATDFSAGEASQWFNYPLGAPGCTALPQVTEADGTDYVRSQAPWWVDINHIAPGLGYVHLVAFAYHRDWSTDGEIPMRSTGLRPLDLRNAEVVLRWRAPQLQLPPDASLLLWFQTRTSALDARPQRYANFVLTGQPLRYTAASGGWQDDVLKLEPVNSRYACLGSSPERADTYGCDLDAIDAMKNWNVDLGIVILFNQAASAAQINGAVELDDLTIHLPADNLDTHRGAAPSIARARNSTC